MADVVVTMESDVAKILRNNERVIAKQQVAIDKLKETVRQSQRIERQSDRTARSSRRMGDTITASLGGVTTAAAAASTAINVITNALRESNQAAQELGRGVESRVQALGLLAQLGPEGRRRGEAVSRRAELAGVPTAEAGTFGFDVVSSAVDDASAQMIARLRAAGVIAAAPQTVRTTAGLVNAFGPQAGSFQQQIAQAFAVSGFSRAGAEQIQTAAGAAGSQFAALGFTDEELLAAIAVGARTVTAPEAGTRVRGLATALARTPTLQRDTLVQTVETLNELTNQELLKAVGSTEAVGAVRSLAGTDLASVVEAARTATPARLEEAIATNLSDPRFRAVVDKRRQEAAAELAAEGLGVAQVESETDVTRRMAAIRRQGGFLSTIQEQALRYGSDIRGAIVPSRFHDYVDPSLFAGLLYPLIAPRSDDASAGSSLDAAATKLDAAADRMTGGTFTPAARREATTVGE